jgi:hypothetical protein
LPVSSISVDPQIEADVYNLVVEGTKTYFVGSSPILVHSCATTLM